MVQSAAAGVAGAAGLVTTALARQKHRELPARRNFDSVLPALAVTDKPSKRKQLISMSREERVWDLLTQPEILGLLTTFGGIIAAQNIRFVGKSANGSDIANEGIQSIATMTAILMGLGQAGVGDLTTAILAGLGGIASLIEGIDINPFDNIVPDVTPDSNWLSGLAGIAPFGLGNLIATYKFIGGLVT